VVWRRRCRAMLRLQKVPASSKLRQDLWGS
jgi:hypothetical protein